MGVGDCRYRSSSCLLHFGPPFWASAHGHTSRFIFIRTHSTVVAFLQYGYWLVQLVRMESKHTESALSILHVLLFQDGWKGGLDFSWWRSPLYHRFVAVSKSFVSPLVLSYCFYRIVTQNLTREKFSYIWEQERRQCMQTLDIFHVSL